MESVQINDINTDNLSFSISILPDTGSDPAVGHGEQNEGQHIPQICYLLLKHGASAKFYHELSMEFSELPQSYLVIMTTV